MNLKDEAVIESSSLRGEDFEEVAVCEDKLGGCKDC